MEKSELKTGMMGMFSDGVIGLLIHSTFITSAGGRLINKLDDNLKRADALYSLDKVYKLSPTYHYAADMRFWSENNYEEFMPHATCVWQREEPILTLDGVEYSESTLRSLIKKAIE